MLFSSMIFLTAFLPLFLLLYYPIRNTAWRNTLLFIFSVFFYAWGEPAFVLLMLFLLSYGVGLILATLMVFFRDTQFLWGIVSMLLMYLTPIFYSESIIPSWFLPIYKLNPLYHVLRFIRSILIDGVSLEPKAYLWCIVLCAVPLLLGILIFRKNQNKFIFNI